MSEDCEYEFANGGSLGTELLNLLDADDIEPGSAVGYQTAKTIYLFHPLGAKIVDTPIKLAMYAPRRPVVENSYALQDDLITAFEAEWKRMNAESTIANAARIARIYGLGSIAMLIDGDSSTDVVDYSQLWRKNISFNVLDPLSTAGSLLLDQNPNSPLFQHVKSIEVGGHKYHQSRCHTVQNEAPVYLAFSPSSFGYAGRSAFQRALYPLKSFVQTMRTDDMVSVKAGLLVTKVKQASSIITQAMKQLSGFKNLMLRRAKTGQVLQIGENDTIESIDLKNLDQPVTVARRNILENIAAACDMPAILLNSETFAQGLAEGSEDAKAIAKYSDEIRRWLEPTYEFMVRICQYRAWNPDFFINLTNKYGDELSGKYSSYFNEWCANFDFKWDESLKSSEADRAKEQKVRFEAATSVYGILSERLANDPENLAALCEWIVSNVNGSNDLFPQTLELDYELMAVRFKENPPDDNTKTYIRETTTDEPRAEEGNQSRSDALSGERLYDDSRTSGLAA